MVIDLKKALSDATRYKEYNTYVFVQTITQPVLNGYIVQILHDGFMFMDDKSAAPFPILFIDLIAPILPSNKKGKDYNFGREKW